MGHCPDCKTELESPSDVTFEEIDFDSGGLLGTAQRFYLVSCEQCESLLGSGVAARNLAMDL